MGPAPLTPAPVDDAQLQATLAGGMAAHKAGQLDRAEAAYREALRMRPAHGEANRLLGLVLQQRRRHDEALPHLLAATSASPGPAAWTALGVTQQAIGQHEAAQSSFDRAISLNPAYVEAWLARGEAWLERGAPERALPDFEHAATLQPAHWQCQLRRARALAALDRHAEALVAWERTLALSPGLAAAMIGRGNALARLARPAEALQAYREVLAAHPDQVEVLNNCGAVLRDLKRYGEAAAAFAELERLRPAYPYVRSNRLHSQRYACDWREHDALVAGIVAGVRAGQAVDVPFSFLAISDDGADQLACATRYAADRFPVMPPLWRATPTPRDDARIRIAYLSADFHDHATCHLMAGLFEQHDRERFRVDAVSFGPDSNDAMRRRILPCFERFQDVRGWSNRQVADWMLERGVDIAIDLKGFTTGNRCGILAHRAAPLQVSFLGYPGSMGAPYIDYLVADAVVAPAAHQDFYSERLLRLPGSYQVNDRARHVSEWAPTRAEAGLPETGFVFCCFNNNYKIGPEIFASWLRLLARHPGSVLWLLEDNADAARNLRAFAAESGIDPQRLVFAPRLPLAEHLARHRLADLFLDTLPCNAHTTASDALWAGLPVLTCPGGAFAARVGASLVHAAGLPELVCADLAAYEQVASSLASDPGRLAGLRARLREHRLSLPLFDTGAFRRHFERALETIWERHRQGLAPAPLDIPAG